MPFPSWKKKATKNNAVSQFFRDHIQSHRQRGGGHLVVETGFPTSLVDLIVKNRQRLKRSSEIGVPRDGSFVMESTPPAPLPPPSPQTPSTQLNHVVEERDDTVAEEVQDRENCKGALMAVLSVSLVVILAFGTKKFAVGLTMSAFFLIFVEYLRRGLFELLIPCSDSKKNLRSLMVKVLRLMGIRAENFEQKNAALKEEVQSDCSDLKNDSLNNRDSIVEYQIVQSKSLLVASIEHVQYKEKGIVKSCGDGNSKSRKPDSLAAFLEEEEEDYTCVELDLKKKKKSRKGEIKSKLKHILARKSRKEKMKEGTSESNLDPTEENNAAEEVKAQSNGRKLEFDDSLASTSSGSSFEGKEESITPVCAFESEKALTEKVIGGDVRRGVEESQKKGNCGYLSLCIIVLIGLSGGRISALLLILSCCLVKKSGGILPMMRNFWPDL